MIEKTDERIYMHEVIVLLDCSETPDGPHYLETLDRQTIADTYLEAGDTLEVNASFKIEQPPNLWRKVRYVMRTVRKSLSPRNGFWRSLRK